MALVSNKVLETLTGESGPFVQGMQIARGQVDLDGAGVAVESIPGFPANATPLVGWNSPVVTAAVGQLKIGYDSSTGNLTITSTSGAAAAGARVNWFLFYF